MAKVKVPVKSLPLITVSTLSETDNVVTWDISGIEPHKVRLMQLHFCDDTTFTFEAGMESQFLFPPISDLRNAKPVSSCPTSFEIPANWSGYETGTVKFVRLFGEYISADFKRGFFFSNVIQATIGF